MTTKAENFAKLQDTLQKAWVDINKYNAAKASWASSADALKAGWYAWQKAQPTSQSTYDASQQKSNQIIQQKQDNLNQLNAMSSQAAQANSRDFQVGTWDVAEMPQQQEIVSPARADRLAKSWSNLTYEQQQDRLSRTAWLKDALAKRGITVKPQPTQTTQPKTTTQQRTTQPQTPKQEQWDYQDNSQARMDQIANNLNGYRQTMPQLFDDWTAFYNFFIKDKGRSQDQIDFLWDYFNRVQKYGKYDNMSPDALWTWIANWDIPEDYLNTLKSTDPQKYQEVMAAKQNREDTIKNESFLNDAATMAWIEWWESEPSSIQYGKWNWIWMDEDSNGIDDRREHYASEEEQWYQKQIADLNAANLDIDNTVKHTYEDLVKAYPWATKATLMAMAQDRNSDLLREKENNLVELTRLQGYVWYMQDERQEMNKAGADSIAQLQKNLWMYYDYSPQWMAERVQAQYAATNVTLDQADSGNETQKQMALQSVLDDYYDKYGSIIQRSEQQVINDVIAYAKKNWVWLSQALQENFVKPLQSKPEFATLSSGRTITNWWTDKWSVETIKDANGNDLSVMVNQATWETRLMNGNAYTWWTSWTTSYGKSYNVVSPTELVDWLSNFVSWYEIWDKWWQCWAFVNNWLKSMGVADSNIYDNSKESKLWSKNEDANASAQTGWVAIWKPEVLTWDWAKYGHVGFVVQDNWDGTVKVLDSNGTKNPQTWKYDETVWVRDVPKSSLYWYFNPSQWIWTAWWADDGEWDLFSAKVLSWIPTQLRNTDVEKKWYLDIAEKQRAKWLSSFETAMSIMWFDITNNSPLAQNTKQKILDATMAQWDEIVFNSAVLSSMAQAINKWDYEKALLTLENQLGSFMSKSDWWDLSRSTVSQWIKAIDSLNWIKWYKNYAKWAWNTVADLIGAEWKNTASFNIWTNNVSRALRWLWYEKEEIDEMLPKLTNDKDTFNNRVSALEEALLWQYNTIRRNHNLPSMTKEALLWNQSLYNIYKIWNTEQLRNQLQNAQNRNINLRYWQPTTITAEAIKII